MPLKVALLRRIPSVRKEAGNIFFLIFAETRLRQDYAEASAENQKTPHSYGIHYFKYNNCTITNSINHVTAYRVEVARRAWWFIFAGASAAKIKDKSFAYFAS